MTPGDGGKEVVRRWNKACLAFADMNVLEKSGLLGKTRMQPYDDRRRLDLRNTDDVVFDHFIMRLFTRYLVWHEHSNKEREDVQPDYANLATFFGKERSKKGVSLADICHAFPHARDVEMLVWRIEHFASYKPGGGRTEGIYVPLERWREVEDEVEPVVKVEDGPDTEVETEVDTDGEDEVASKKKKKKKSMLKPNSNMKAGQKRKREVKNEVVSAKKRMLKCSGKAKTKSKTGRG